MFISNRDHKLTDMCRRTSPFVAFSRPLHLPHESYLFSRQWVGEIFNTLGRFEIVWSTPIFVSEIVEVGDAHGGRNSDIFRSKKHVYKSAMKKYLVQWDLRDEIPPFTHIYFIRSMKFTDESRLLPFRISEKETWISPEFDFQTLRCFPGFAKTSFLKQIKDSGIHGNIAAPNWGL